LRPVWLAAQDFTALIIVSFEEGKSCAFVAKTISEKIKAKRFMCLYITTKYEPHRWVTQY